MENSFWFGSDLPDFLFENFDINSPIGMITVCICTAILVIVYECLETNRIIKSLKCQLLPNVSFLRFAFSRASEKSTLLHQNGSPQPQRCVWRILDLFSHFFGVVIGYLLMMVAMTFNAYIMISIFIGAGLSYLIFGSVRLNITAQVVANKLCEGCQLRTDGETTPVFQAKNEENASTSAICETEDESNRTEEKVVCTVAQIHNVS